MKNLLDTQRTNEILERFDFSQEMIDPQLDDYSVNVISSKFSEILEIAKYTTFTTNLGLYKQPKVRKLLKEIEEVIYTRFGFRSTIGSIEEDLMAVLISPPKISTALNLDAKATFDRMEGYIQNRPTGLSENGGDLILNKSEYIKQTHSNISQLSDDLKIGSIKIDLAKAKVVGLSNDYTIVFLLGLKNIVDTKLTPRECTACLYHEIGHIFTSLEYVYRTTNVVTTLSDLVQEFSGDPEKLNKEINTRILNDKINLSSGFDSLNGTRLISTIYNDFFVVGSKHSKTDNEAMADTFVMRFGLGKELSSALLKNPSGIRIEDILQITAISYISLFFITVGFPVIWVATNVILYTFMKILDRTIMGNIGDLFRGSSYSTSNTYDNDSDRIGRMKNDLIRQMKTMNLPAYKMKETLHLIDELDKKEKDLKKSRKFFEVLGDNMSWNNEDYNTTVMEKALEKLTLNKLFYHKVKLEMINDTKERAKR